MSDGNAASRASSLLQRLLRDAATLGVCFAKMTGCACARSLMSFALEQAYNLTAISAAEQMLTHHLLDSLAIHADLVGDAIADVGTGAGFPGTAARTHSSRAAFLAH